jgi:hypothetical protein
MARGDKSKAIGQAKENARESQERLQGAGLSKRSAEKRAWDQANPGSRGRGTTSAGTASGRSKVSKRTMTPKGSTAKAKTTGKSRR